MVTTSELTQSHAILGPKMCRHFCSKQDLGWASPWWVLPLSVAFHGTCWHQSSPADPQGLIPSLSHCVPATSIF